MKRIIAITIGTSVVLAMLALSGCSGEDAQRGADALSEAASDARDVAADAANQAGDAAAGAAESAQDAAASAADSASGALESAGGAMSDAADGMQQEASEGAGGLMGAAAGALGGSPADVCRKLAAQQNWEKALSVCREALKLFPNDMELEHAVQQAEAAAE